MTTDVKIMRNEHSELMHSFYKLDKSNQELRSTNKKLSLKIENVKSDVPYSMKMGTGPLRVRDENLPPAPT